MTNTKLQNIRLIALDLDDTLLRHDLSISDRTVQTLRKAIDRGIIVMLASGRSPDAMKPYATRIGLDTLPSFIISNNGSQIFASDTNTILKEVFLPEHIALEAYRLATAAGLSCHIYEDKIIHISKETQWSHQDQQLSGLKSILKEDYEAIIREGVYKLVIPGDPDFLIPIESEFKVLLEGSATVFISKPYFMEVLPFNTGKGEALKVIVEEYLHLSSENVMAFGDSMNDESMIRYAGHSVAMKNSRPEILKLARHHTFLTNDEDGVADFIEQMVF